VDLELLQLRWACCILAFSLEAAASIVGVTILEGSWA